MQSKLIVKAAREGRMIARVTPESAGWRYVGFEALRLAPGEKWTGATGGRELCIVLVAGRASIESDELAWHDLGSRASPFENVGPYAVYLPPGRDLTITAQTDAEIALCSAPAAKGVAPRLIEPASMRRTVRGQGSNTRYVRDILPQDEPAEALLVVEVITPPGHSSSYPPHKHDTDAVPHGYTSYYLNVMAGPHRVWHFKNDPAHEWMLAPKA